MSPSPPTGRVGPRALASLAVVAAVLFVFSNVVFRGRVLFGGDLHGLLWGQCAAFAAVVKGGAWPVWNPFLGLGQPLLANPGAQVLYPLTWLNLLIRPETYVSLYAVAHLLLAGAGMLWLARLLRVSWAGATVAALTWVLSGPLLSAVHLWQHFAGAAWMPWVVGSALRALERPSVGRMLVWAAVQSAQVLTGSVDLVALTAVPQAGLLLTRLSWRHPLDRANGRLLATGAGATALTVGWTALLWIPALDYLGRTTRAQQPVWERMKWSVPPLELVQTLLPVLPQDLPLRDNVRKALYDGYDPLFASLYLGLPALVLALAAWGSPRKRLAGALAGLVALSLLVALGRHGFVYFWLTETLPPVTVLRYPVKVTLLTAFAFSLLVGVGLQAWASGAMSRGRARAVAAVVGLLGAAALAATSWAHGHTAVLLDDTAGDPRLAAITAGVLAVATWSGSAALAGAGLAALGTFAPGPWRGRLIGALAFLVVVDLAVVHRGLTPAVERDFVSTPPDVVKVLRADDARRVYVFDYLLTLQGIESLRPAPPPALDRLSPPWRNLVQAQAYPTSTPRWGLRGSFDLDIVGLDSPRRKGLGRLVIAVERDPDLLLRILQVVGVTHVVGLHRQGLERLEPLATVSHSLLGPIHVYRVPEPLPVASLVPGSRVAVGWPAYQALLAPAYDPRRTVLLREGEGQAPPTDFGGEVEVLEERADRLHLETLASAASLLLVTEGFDAGWTATVDGRPAPVLAADLVLQAVPVPAGRHRVELAYRPPGWPAGWRLTLLSVVGALGLAGMNHARRRKTEQTPVEMSA